MRGHRFLNSRAGQRPRPQGRQLGSDSDDRQDYVEPMRAAPVVSAVGAVLVLIAITACGGSDNATSANDQPSSSEPAASQGVPATDDGADAAEVDDAPATTNEPATAGVSGGDLMCDDIFSSAEMAEWFGEPAEMTQEATESLGQLVCVWETIEDLEDLDDLAVSIVTGQVFSGDPIPAANFIDPDIFEEVTMLDGLGDVAFYTGETGGGYYFFDDPVAGTLNLTDLDFGDSDAPALHTSEELEALFRTFHARVAG